MRQFAPFPTKVVFRLPGGKFDTFPMNRRALQSILILVLSVPAAAYFVVLPQWEIEHPSDSSLVLRSERHWLWRAPVHAHLALGAIAIPVLAIAIVAIALLVVIQQTEY